VHKRLVGLGIVPVANTPEEFAQQIAAEAALWEPVIRKAGIKAN